MHITLLIICLSKLIEYTTARGDCNTNYELWVIMTCQRRFTDCSNCTSLVQDVENVG